MTSVFEVLSGLNINGHTEKKKTGNTELTYLSWPWAWAEVKKRYPEAHYTVWKDADGRPYAFDPITGFMVYTTVTIGAESHDMWLPVMDGANNAMKSEPYDYKVKNPLFKYAKYDEKRGGYYDKYNNLQEEYIVKHVNAATMFDINKAIMRCLVKNLAMFGLGLYIYAGEDLPEDDTTVSQAKANDLNIPSENTPNCERCQKVVTAGEDLPEDDTTVSQAKAKGLNIPTENTPTCERCHKVVTGWVGDDGKRYSATAIFKRSQKLFGANYCMACQRKLEAKNAERTAG